MRKMYIPDGNPYDYHEGADPKFYAWGWLSSDQSFCSGWESTRKKEITLSCVEKIPKVDRYRGSYFDEGLGLVWGDPESPRSSCSRKFKYNGTIYTAPECVDYYIRELDYKPPDQVIEALIDKFGDLNLEDA